MMDNAKAESLKQNPTLRDCGRFAMQTLGECALTKHAIFEYFPTPGGDWHETMYFGDADIPSIIDGLEKVVVYLKSQPGGA